MKKLTLRRLQKRHKENPQDKELHMTIENAEVDEKTFDSLVERGTKEEAFDKPKKT